MGGDINLPIQRIDPSLEFLDGARGELEDILKIIRRSFIHGRGHDVLVIGMTVGIRCTVMSRTQTEERETIKHTAFMMTSSNGNFFRVTGPLEGIHRWPVDSPHQGQWRWALMFSLICVRTKGWANNRATGDLRRHRAHYGATIIMKIRTRQ